MRVAKIPVKTPPVSWARHTLASFAGQLFDSSGTHLLTGPKDWPVPVDHQVQSIFWKAVTAYFLLCKLSHKRCHLYLHPATRYFYSAEVMAASIYKL